MLRAWRVADVRAAESALMARVPEGALMQRAAAGLATAVARRLRGTYGSRVVLLVGSGNNGGDALWAGARLARRGARVDAVLLEPGRAHAGGLTALRAAGGRVVAASDRAAVRDVVALAHVVVDGVVGLGAEPGLRPAAADVLDLVEQHGVPVVAVDLPSGLAPDSGEVPGRCVHAASTVTFGAAKPGLLVDPGATAAGDVEVVDIGLRPHLPARADLEVLDAEDVATLLPQPGPADDKYSRGVVGVVAGSSTYTGAAVLAVGGAVHGGAGMVRYVGPDEPTRLVRSRWPEVVVGEGRVQAWVVGPGFGEHRGAEVGHLMGAGVPLLVDADGLHYLPLRFPGPALLTPHAGELARLLGVERRVVEAGRLHHARDAARRWGATVLLKGSTTVVADPDGRTRVARRAAPWLATAGSGDVLSGLAGALLAAGLPPFDAGSVAAHVHGLAGELAGDRAGAPSAQDVLAAVPEALRLLRAGR